MGTKTDSSRPEGMVLMLLRKGCCLWLLLSSCTGKRPVLVRDTASVRPDSVRSDSGAADSGQVSTQDSAGGDTSVDSGPVDPPDSGGQGDLVCSAWLSPVAVSEVEDASLEEISGLVVSQINPGILWVLEDSGADPVLTALGVDGSVQGTLTLSGVANRDWEDLASGPCGEETCLFVGEFGDNGAVRTDASIMRVEEPLLDGAVGFSLSVEPSVYPFTYPEGPQDAEALVVEPDGTSVVLTKRSDGTARAYRLPLVADVSVDAVLLGEIALGTGEGLANMATAADIWPDGTQMIVRTYTGAWVFSLADDGVADAISAAGSEVTTGLEMQGEAMAYDAADGSIWHVSEGVNPTLFRLPCAD